MQEIEDTKGENLLDTLEIEVLTELGFCKLLERPSGAWQLLFPLLTLLQALSIRSLTSSNIFTTLSNRLLTPALSIPSINDY